MKLQDILEYRDGALYWKVSTNRRITVGSRAGTENTSNGKLRRAVRVLGKVRKEHRVIWELLNGPIPDALQIDHINGDAADNRIENLRLATGSQNQENRRCRGTHFCNTVGMWLAKIQVKGHTRTLGKFPTEAAAHSAYVQAKRQLHEFCTI